MMMEKKQVSKTLTFSSILTRLINREDFSLFITCVKLQKPVCFCMGIRLQTSDFSIRFLILISDWCKQFNVKF
jgi:hypothetical protein